VNHLSRGLDSAGDLVFVIIAWYIFMRAVNFDDEERKCFLDFQHRTEMFVSCWKSVQQDTRCSSRLC